MNIKPIKTKKDYKTALKRIPILAFRSDHLLLIGKREKTPKETQSGTH